MNLGNLEGFFIGELRQNGRNSARKHRLTRDGRADQKYVVPARNGNLRRALGALLPLDFGKIRGVARFAALPALGRVRGNHRVPAHVVAKRRERRHRQNRNALDIGRFFRVSLRYRKHGFSLRKRVDHHRQHARDCADAAVEPQLAKGDELQRRVRAELTGRRKNGQRNGQVVDRALLAHIRGREVHRNPRRRKHVACILNRRADTLAGFLHRRVRQPHDFKRGQSVGNIRFNLYAKSANSI